MAKIKHITTGPPTKAAAIGTLAIDDGGRLYTNIDGTALGWKRTDRRQIATGTTVIGASSNVVLTAFLRQANETVWFTIWGSAKTVNYEIPQETGGIPADETVRMGIQKTTTLDQMRLVAANGLEGVTLEWIVYGLTP